MQAMHFSFALGAFASPLLVRSFHEEDEAALHSEVGEAQLRYARQQVAQEVEVLARRHAREGNQNIYKKHRLNRQAPRPFWR